MSNLAISAWQGLAVTALATIYFFLALFRTAQLEVPSLKLGSVLRTVGKQGGLLDRWNSQEHRVLLLTAVQVAFQGILILTTLVAAGLVEQMFPQWSTALRLGAAFGGTVFLLVIVTRTLLVRVIVWLAPERAVRLGGLVATALAVFLLPVLVPLDRLARVVSARFKTPQEDKPEHPMEEEVHAFVSMGEEEGILEKDEGDLVRNVVDFGDTIVREIMTPRTRMVVIDRKANLGEVRKIFIEAKLSRIPVQRESADHIEGVLTIKDLLPIWCEAPETSVESLVRPVMFVPETKNVHDLLKEMQQARVPFALVADEYGGTAGLVSVEDIVEEIVGEIQDEHEMGESEILEEGPDTWLVSGFADVDEIAELMNIDIQEMDVDTVGGLVTAHLGRVPAVGECMEIGDARMEVTAADERRVLKIRMTRVHSDVPVHGKGK